MPTAGGPDCAQPARWVPPVALVAFVPAGTWIRPPSCRALGSPMDNVIAFVAQYFFILSIAIACLGWLRLPAGKKWALAAAGIAGGVVRPGPITLAGSLYYDPRAFAAHHLHPLFAMPLARWAAPWIVRKLLMAPASAKEPGSTHGPVTSPRR